MDAHESTAAAIDAPVRNEEPSRLVRTVFASSTLSKSAAMICDVGSADREKDIEGELPAALTSFVQRSTPCSKHTGLRRKRVRYRGHTKRSKDAGRLVNIACSKNKVKSKRVPTWGPKVSSPVQGVAFTPRECSHSIVGEKSEVSGNYEAYDVSIKVGGFNRGSSVTTKLRKSAAAKDPHYVGKL
jgi:hypothetical protein